MGWFLGLGMALGTTLAKSMLEEWLGKGLPTDLLSEVVDFGADQLQKDAPLQVRKVVRQTVRDLKPLVERECRSLDEAARERVVIAVSKTLAGVDAKLFVQHDLDAEAVAQHVIAQHAQAVEGFSADESTLYRRLVGEVCEALLRVAHELDGFETAAWGEVLRDHAQTQDMLAQVSAIVARLVSERQSTVNVPDFTPEQWEAAEQRYRELALESCDIIDLANLPEDRHIATRQLELRHLYVPLRVRVESKPADEEDNDESEAHWQTLEKRRRTYRWWQSKTREQGEEEERLPIGERLSAARRLVVLGDPGAGKSTLVRWIATAYLLRLKNDPEWEELPDVETLPRTNWLPILIRCRDLDHKSVTGALDDILSHTLRKAEMTEDESACFRNYLPEKMRRGEALLLLDGLDEIQDPGLRSRFSRQIERVASAYPDLPIIATSRIVGYREMGYRIGRDFEHVVITDLTPEEKDLFIRRWGALTERPEHRDAAIRDLIHDVHSTDRIERLTGNPMLLTTLALVRRRVGRLPHRRVELYEEAVRVLLNWRSDVGETLDTREALPQLEYLAYAMCEQGIQQINQDDVLALFKAMRAAYPNVRPARNHTPEEFLHLIEARTGLLIEAGHTRHDGRLVPVYEFRHLTFQEYLAGLAIVQKKYPGYQRGDLIENIIAPLAGQVKEVSGEWAVVENWREALRLCVAACNDEDVDPALRAILTPLPEEDAQVTTRPRAAMAALCLADEPNVSNNVAEEILHAFTTNIKEKEALSSEPRTILDAAALEIAVSIWSKALQAALINEFIKRPTMSSWNPGGLCGMVISASLPKNETAIRAWLEHQVLILSTGEHHAIRAALGIMTLAYEKRGYAVPGMPPALLKMLSADAPSARAAAWALGWLSKEEKLGDKAWQPTDIEMQHICTFIGNRHSDPIATRFLTWIFQTIPDPRAVEPLLARIDDPEADVRHPVVQALGNIGDTRAVEPLIVRLDDPDIEVRKAVADALGKIGDARSIDPLIARLGDSDTYVRQAVADALGGLGDARAVAPLLSRLDDPEPPVRYAVARALGQLDTAQAVPMLQSNDSAIRGGALQGLSHHVSDEIDRDLLSRYFFDGASALDPAEGIDAARVAKAANRLDLTEEEVRRRYETLAERFGLRLAWQSGSEKRP